MVSLVLCSLFVQFVDAAIPIPTNMRSIGTVCKSCPLPPLTEQVVFEYSGGPGLITQQWWGGPIVGAAGARMRVYIDGSNSTSIDYDLLLAHGVGPNQNHGPGGETPWTQPGI